MTVQMKRLLVLALIVLKESGPADACADRCDDYACPCSGLGFSRVPQFLPTHVARLDLTSNAITTVNPPDFARYYNLQALDLRTNHISTINSRAFYNLSSLTSLHLAANRLASLRADMFIGLDSLEYMDLRFNSIQNVESPTFNNTPLLNTLMFSNNRIISVPADMFGLDMSVLQVLDLSHNQINAFPVEGFGNLSISALSDLQMEYNRIKTLPLAAFDILASLRYVSIDQNPWQCDCRMLPFKERLTGFYTFEYTITCASPANLQGKSLLHDVNPEDLICGEEAATGSPDDVTPETLNTQRPHEAADVVVTAHWLGVADTPPPPAPAATTPPRNSHGQPGRTEGYTGASSGGFPVQVFLTGFLPGILLGVLLASAVFVPLWCCYRRGKSAGSVPDRGAVFSNIDTTATVTAICPDQRGGHAFIIEKS
ncbi:SLIT and NTRK-like protein 2 isoform X2 [Branchiostoma lanceolatum]